MNLKEEKYQTETGDKPAFRRKWLVAMTVGTAVFLATLDGSIVNVSLPTMVASLGTNFAVIQWVVLGYLLTVTTLTLGFGRLGDTLGKKRVYLAGLTIFTVASALCGLSSHVLWLIMFRVVQGVGAAMAMALGPAILTEAFPPQERGKDSRGRVVEGSRGKTKTKKPGNGYNLFLKRSQLVLPGKNGRIKITPNTVESFPSTP